MALTDGSSKCILGYSQLLERVAHLIVCNFLSFSRGASFRIVVVVLAMWSTTLRSFLLSWTWHLERKLWGLGLDEVLW
jgi:hypothetical protein